MGCGSSRNISPAKNQPNPISYQIDELEVPEFKPRSKLRPKTSTEIDVIEFSKSHEKLENLNEDIEIVSIRKIQSLDEALKRSSEVQTDPVNPDVFDWDLSDRADIETQTNPPTRATSSNQNEKFEINDAIVQTDQRLTYLVRKNKKIMPEKRKTFVDASVQTFIEMQSIGIQVDPVELSEFSGFGRKKSMTPFNFEDASDFSDADISTVHAHSFGKSAKKRLIRNRDGTFMGSPDHSDPDEIIYASEAQIISREISPVPTQSDAGFQINMAVAAVASSNSNKEMSSPVGYAITNSGKKVVFICCLF